MNAVCVELWCSISLKHLGTFLFGTLSRVRVVARLDDPRTRRTFQIPLTERQHARVQCRNFNPSRVGKFLGGVLGDSGLLCFDCVDDVLRVLDLDLEVV